MADLVWAEEHSVVNKEEGCLIEFQTKNITIEASHQKIAGGKKGLVCVCVCVCEKEKAAIPLGA